MGGQLSSEAPSGYRLHPDVIWIARSDGSVYLMHMSGNVCAIDADATSLLSAILASGPEGAAVSLAARGDIEHHQALDDVQEFMGVLRKQKLIQQFPYRKSPLENARERAAVALVTLEIRFAKALKKNPHARTRGILWTARWAVTLFGWAATVRAWEHVHPQPPSDAPAAAEKLDAIAHAVLQTASRSIVQLECKERSLACLALARESGIPARLVVGVAQDPMLGHVWVEAGDRIISDDPEHCRSFEPVAHYG